jgi:hypothetical protein
MFAPHPDKLYVPVKPIPDYEIRIDRPLKRACIKRWDDFFEYMETMWDLIPDKPTPAALTAAADALNNPLDYDLRGSWYPPLQYLKATNGWSKADFRAHVESVVMARDLPYEVKRVPEIKMSHTQHWSMNRVQQLGMRGMLDDLDEVT